MNLPATYATKFSKQATGQPRSAWEEQLDRFAARLNPDRIKAGFRPYSHARIAKLLSNAGINDAAGAHHFFRKLEVEARVFGRLFDKLTKKV
jgi:hypothetical protein